jgi:hypothetical protein
MRLVLIAFGLFCASCVATPTVEPVVAVTPTTTLSPGEYRSPEMSMTSTADPHTPIPPTVEGPFIQRTNWLLLGGDYRAHREGTGFGNKTYVIVLVSVLETDPMDIAVVQFPRNLYVPIEGMDDQWLFAVWGNDGWQGLHQYFQRAFGIPLQGIHYVSMDSFVTVVDGLGMDGEDTLAYLRDNENNWELGSYDAGQRVFQVLSRLWVKGSTFFLDDPVMATNVVYSQWGDLFETDLSNIEQLYWLFRLGWRVKNSEYEIRFIQLEDPFIVRGDTPIIQNEQPMRGMIPTLDLRDWMLDCVLDQLCEADL